MKKEKIKYPYLHIIESQVQKDFRPHPFDGIKTKLIFAKYLSQDLELPISEIDDISNKKENLFRIYYKNLYYNIFIEHPDGGGRDIYHKNTGKKVAIPFHIKAFKKIINDFERVLVINIYFPLCKNFQLDYENRVYLIVNPKEIYESQVVKNDKKNPSSRWVNLEQIIKVIKNENYSLNKRQNVYVVHWKKIQWFFDNYLKNEYKRMIYKISNNFIEKNINKDSFVGKYRKIFRERLIDSRGIKCEIINCQINIVELLIASHIKPVKLIKDDKKLKEQQKKEQIQDPFNGFLLCPNHDAVFDKFLISFDKEGKLLFAKILENNAKDFNLKTDQVVIKLSTENLQYLDFHNKLFKQKNL